MWKRALIASSLFAICFMVQPLHAQDKIEIFGGYSFLRSGATPEVPLLIPGCPSCPPPPSSIGINTNGWEVTGVFKPSRWLGIAADLSGHYDTSIRHNFTYLFGPQISLPVGRISPFAHVLLGATNQSRFGSDNGNAFASAIGGGIDVKVSHFVSFRLVQVDYYMIRFIGQTQNGIRVSTGIVVHF